MSVKKVLEKYLNKLVEGYSNTEENYPMIPKRADVDPMLYVGEPDDEGWCRWKPVLKDKIHELNDIEQEHGIILHNSIKEYFNSYWFFELWSTFKKFRISMQAIEPNRELDSFKKILKGYKEEHNNELKHIPLGSEMKNGYLIVIDNETGKVKIEDYDKGTYKTIAENLEEFISSLEPDII